MPKDPLFHYSELLGRMCGIIDGVCVRRTTDPAEARDVIRSLPLEYLQNVLVRLAVLRNYHDEWREEMCDVMYRSTDEEGNP